MQINKVEIVGNIPPLVNKFHGKLALLGCAANVWEDYDKLKKIWIGDTWDVMAVNYMAFVKDRIEHLVVLHAEIISPMLSIRNTREMTQIGAVHCKEQAPGVDHAWYVVDRLGTVSMFGCKIAIAMGYTQIVLCGVPMDKQAHFFDNPYEPIRCFPSAEQFQDQVGYWEKAKDEVFAGRVKSMSGNTRDILGGI